MTNRAIAGRNGRVSYRPGSHKVCVTLVAMILAVAGTTAGQGAYAQAAGGEPVTSKSTKTEPDVAKVLEDYVHYIKIQNYEMAAGKAQELIDKKLANAEFVKLVEATDKDRFIEATQRALRVQRLEPLAAKLDKAFQDGALERVRNPAYITESITGLTGRARERNLSQQRLLAAGEYAMPQLLEAFINPANPQLQNEVERVMIGLGRHAIAPLTTALMKLPVNQQEQIVNTLGKIQYRSSLPFLSDLRDSTQSDAVRGACNHAIESLGGAAGSTTEMYRALADAYYREGADVTSFMGEDHQLLWDYAPGAGLLMTAIKTPVFHEARAMTLLERGMQIESAAGSVAPETLALWVAANFSRETDTPEGYVNPAYPVVGAALPGQEPRRSATYFAVAAGSDISQRVLSRAIDDKDTPLARQSLAAVEQTAGVGALGGQGGRLPLIEAITYPNRRVQYEAALAISASQPNQAFPGSDRVVPTLASTIRGATTQVAAVVTMDNEAYQTLRSQLQGMGYTVLPQGRTLRDLEAPIAEAPAVDLIVGYGMTGDKVPALIEEVRGWSKIAATPVAILTSAESYTELRRRYDSDETVAIRQAGIPEAAVAATVTQLVQTASGGPISPEEATSYARRSLSALRDLAVSQSQVLNVSDATLPLIAALGETQSATRMQVADILARVGQERAQRAIMEAALAGSGADRVALLGMVADSAKRFGNMLEPRHVTRIVEVASKSGDDEATAAASLMGALNLSNAELVPLILKKK